jgi:preprotein translocase subunit YajC
MLTSPASPAITPLFRSPGPVGVDSLVAAEANPFAPALTLQALEAPTPGPGPSDKPAGGFSPSSLMPIVLVAAIFWFVVIGPERKNRKNREAMLAAIKKGDRVLTTGGLYGHVAQVQDQVVTLTVADGVRMRFARSAIQAVLAEENVKEAAAS